MTKLFYYRYRSGSELALKELIYDELYFASKDECNDPYEGKIFVKFDADNYLWSKIINDALSKYVDNSLSMLKDRIITFFVNQSPIYVDEVLDFLRSGLVYLAHNDKETQILKNMSGDISNHILLHLPPEQYFASFSKNRDNYLLWSHYANNHKGFCLIFRAKNGSLQQSNTWQKESVPLATSDITMPRLIDVYVPQSFEFRDVEYPAIPECMNGADFFPFSNQPYADSPNKSEHLIEKYTRTYLQKHNVWDYEEETRIILSLWAPFVMGRKVIIPSHHRLFHYEPKQLAGIVLGANMPMEQDLRIKDILYEKVCRLNTQVSEDQSFHGFVVFKEHFSASERKIQSIPVEIYDGISVLYPNHPDFQNLLKKWESV